MDHTFRRDRRTVLGPAGHPEVKSQMLRVHTSQGTQANGRESDAPRRDVAKSRGRRHRDPASLIRQSSWISVGAFSLNDHERVYLLHNLPFGNCIAAE